MRKLLFLAISCVFLGALGCGSSTELKTTPLTAEEQQKIKQEDAEREAEEGGYGRKNKLPQKRQ